MPLDPLRLRGTLDLFPDGADQRLLPAAARGEVGVEELEGPETVRGREHKVADDAAHRHGPDQGPRLPEARRALRKGQRPILQGFLRRRRQAVRVGRPLPDQAGGSLRLQASSRLGVNFF